MTTQTETATRRVIDMTPTWSEVVDIIATGIKDGNATGRKAATTELRRMADLADIASIFMGAHRRPDAPMPDGITLADMVERCVSFIRAAKADDVHSAMIERPRHVAAAVETMRKESTNA